MIPKAKESHKEGQEETYQEPLKIQKKQEEEKFDSNDTEVFHSIAASAKYHEMEDKFLHIARLNCFAALLHLIKSPENAVSVVCACLKEIVVVCFRRKCNKLMQIC